MFSNKIKMSLSFLLALVMGISLLCTTAFATTVEVLDGQVSVTDSVGNGSVSNGTVTITAKGSLFSKKTNNITITNETGDKATLSFDYTVTSANSFEIAGATAEASGSYSVLLDAGASVSITLVSNSGLINTTATLKLSSFGLTVAAASSNVKFVYDSTLGSITVDGTVTGSGAVIEDISLGTEVALVATPASGATFHGWINAENGQILSTAASYTLAPAQDITVQAVFTGAASTTKGWFLVNNAYLFDDLTLADDCAKNAGGKTIVLVNSGTLPSGKNYTISSGNSFLIPCQTNDDGRFDTYPETVESKTGGTGAFMTLTIPNGVELTVEGKMCINGKQGTPGAGNTGHVTGKFGQVVLNGTDAKLTVKGTLRCYGYITGSGIVHAVSGGTVYEFFQLKDWRGGSATLDWYGGIGGNGTFYESFICSEYFIQNIEARYRVDYGSFAKAIAAMSVTLLGVQQTDAVVIGDGGLFQLGLNSYVVREYKADKDRIYYDLYGTVTTAGINLSVATYKLNSANNVLGVQHGMTVTVKGTDESGNALNSKGIVTKAFKLLPGSEIIVEENAELEIDSGTRLFLYDLDDWKSTYTYRDTGVDKTELSVQTVKYTPSQKGTRAELKSALLQVDGTLTGYSNIFTTNNGATSQDKVLIGKGTFINKAAASSDTVDYTQLLDEMNNNSADDRVWITVAPVVGLLAGISTDVTDVNDSFGTGTYECLGSDHHYYWYINSADVAATCEKAAYTKYYCTDETAYYEIPSADTTLAEHQYESVTTEPTCSDAGFTTYTCSVCDDTYTGGTVAALGHTEVIDAGVDATCTTTGLTEGSHCETCGATIVEQEEIPAYHTCTNDSAPHMICPGCAGSFIRCESESGFTYEEFTLTVTNWYVEEYVSGETWVGFAAKFEGSEAAKAVLTEIGFRVNGVETWGTWTTAPEEYTFNCLVQTTETTNTAQALVAFDVVDTNGDYLAYASKSVTLDLNSEAVNLIREEAEATVSES